MRFSGLVFFVVGLAMLGFGLYLFNDSRLFMETAVAAQGEVVSFDRKFDRSAGSRDRGDTYYPIIAFTARNGVKVRFEGNVGSNPPAYQVGEHVEVLYDAINPNNARLGDFFSLWFGTILTGAMGAIFTAVGLFITLRGFKRKADRDWLLSSGQIVQADIVRVEYEKSTVDSVKGAWYILAQWQDPRTRKVHVMRSDDIPFDPTPYLPADHIPVRINPLNPEKYWVDTSFLPESA